MNKYTFNRNEFEWAEEFYDIIQKRMNLPEWFGKNADALWDMLTGHIGLPCEITLIGFNQKENDYNKYKLVLKTPKKSIQRTSKLLWNKNISHKINYGFFILIIYKLNIGVTIIAIYF